MAEKKGNTKRIDRFIYFQDQLLGKGQFGKVYKGQVEKTGEQVAVKQIEKTTIQSDPYLIKGLFSEITVMKCLKNENIVELIDVLETTNNFYIIQEFCDGGDFSKYLKERQFLQEAEAIKILCDLLNGFTELFRNGVIHRDLKPENILIGKNKFKIADFGFARTVDNFSKQMLQSSVGTPLYMSPQILQQLKYTSKSDIWSLAVIFYEMLNGQMPFAAKSQYQLVQNILAQKPLEFRKGIELSDTTKDFLSKCLKVQEKERLSWKNVFLHELFKNKFESKIKTGDQLEDKAQYVINDLRAEIYKSKIDIQALFEQFDSSKDKKLQIKEFTQLINTIDKNLQREEIEYIFNKFDSNRDGTIDFSEFKDFVQDSFILRHKKVKDLGANEKIAVEVIQKLKQSIQVHKINTFKQHLQQALLKI